MSYRLHILIVDTDVHLSNGLQTVLDTQDVKIVTALSEREAAALLATKDFDLILLDLMVPGMKFSAVIDYIYKRNVDTLVVLMSKDIPGEATESIRRERVYGFLQKPVDFSQVITIVQAALLQKMNDQRRRNQIEGGPTDRRSGRERRNLWKDRRLVKDPWYPGSERRCGKDRRAGRDRRRPGAAAAKLSSPATQPSIAKSSYTRLFEQFFSRRRTGRVREKRKHPRVNVSWPLTMSGFLGATRGKIKDVSVGGALICAGNFLKLGEMFSVRIDRGAASHQALSLLARVVRVGTHCIDDIGYPYGAAVEFVRISDDNLRMLSDSISRSLTRSEPAVARSFIEQPKQGGEAMAEEKGSMELVVNPDLYPVMKLVWKDLATHDNILEATTPLHKEVWLGLAKECRDRAAQIDVYSSQQLVSGLNLLADLILAEVTAEEKRERNRAAYDSFADFVGEINARTDLDKTRKAQMIHDRASQLKLS
jgi:CheY-like chemotaxis protein